MIDFLQKNVSVTREQYLWEWSVPQIKLASYDFTHVVYMNSKHKAKKYDNIRDYMGANNIKSFDNNSNKE